MSFIQNMEQEFTNQLGYPPKVEPQHMDMFARYTTPESLVTLISEIIDNEERLDEIAARSYRHTLGFSKIIISHQDVTIGEETKRGMQLRLHIWDPKSDHIADDFEDYHREEIHAHTFDFLSRIVTGELDNQCFTATPMTDEQESELSLLKEKLSILSAEDKDVILSFIGAQISNASSDIDMSLTNNFNAIVKHASISDKQLNLLRSGFDFFHDGTPKQTFAQSVVIKPYQAINAQRGDIYYHNHHVPHRVCQPMHMHSSTVILLTDVCPTAKGGSYRPAAMADTDFEFTYDMFEPKHLKDILIQYRDHLKSDIHFKTQHRMEVVAP